jgi:hypothetical protein
MLCVYGTVSQQASVTRQVPKVINQHLDAFAPGELLGERAVSFHLCEAVLTESHLYHACSCLKK